MEPADMTPTAEIDARLARVIEKGFIDFPTAFEIVADADAAGAEHHDDCSWHAGMLCDCYVLTKSPEYLAVYVNPPALPEPAPCPECQYGKHQNCTGEVLAPEEAAEPWTPCPCRVDGHPEQP